MVSNAVTITLRFAITIEFMINLGIISQLLRTDQSRRTMAHEVTSRVNSAWAPQ